MHNTYTPTFFNRRNLFLRGLMLDNQAWFASRDIARLLSVQYPDSFHHRFFPHEVQTLPLTYSTGTTEDTVLLSEAAIYKAFVRFGHPELETLDRWLAQDVLPTLRDEHAPGSDAPRRVKLMWDTRQWLLLNWQGGIWMRWEDVPKLIWRE
jgi:prophage antirepressor-like protein